MICIKCKDYDRKTKKCKITGNFTARKKPCDVKENK
jgi:hypothetical protein